MLLQVPLARGVSSRGPRARCAPSCSSTTSRRRERNERRVFCPMAAARPALRSQPRFDRPAGHPGADRSVAQ
eukprot:4641580-Pyramimonas_sp.AAC.1